MSEIGKSKWHWLVRGILVGMMLIAGLNATSYLFRSENIDHLLEGNKVSVAAIGFPLEVWNHNYGPGRIHIGNTAINVLTGLLLGCVAGCCCVYNRQRLNKWVAEFEREENDRKKVKAQSSFQFSLSGLLLSTFLIAGLTAAVTHWAGTRELLLFVYILGPITLIGIAFMPRNIGWQARCVVLLLAAIVVIGGAIASGNMRGLEFDRTMMGIFIFWTPQSAFGACIVLIGLFIQRLRNDRLVSSQN